MWNSPLLPAADYKLASHPPHGRGLYTFCMCPGGTVVAAPTIAEDKKSMTIACNLGSSTKAETCIVKSTIKNDSTFDIQLSANPTVTTNNTYINSVATTWITTTSNTGDVKQNDIIPAGEEHEIQILISTKELTQENQVEREKYIFQIELIIFLAVNYKYHYKCLFLHLEED